MMCEAFNLCFKSMVADLLDPQHRAKGFVVLNHTDAAWCGNRGDCGDHGRQKVGSGWEPAAMKWDDEGGQQGTLGKTIRSVDEIQYPPSSN